MVVTDVAGGLSIYFHPEALPAFSEIAQKLPSTSFIPENLFPSISARHDVMDGTGKNSIRGGRVTGMATLPAKAA
jgi:hypothetical protein